MCGREGRGGRERGAMRCGARAVMGGNAGTSQWTYLGIVRLCVESPRGDPRSTQKTYRVATKVVKVFFWRAKTQKGSQVVGHPRPAAFMLTLPGIRGLDPVTQGPYRVPHLRDSG